MALYYTLKDYIFENELGSFIDYLYFSVITSTTLGYGDVVPDYFLGKVLVIIQTISSLGIFGLFLNDIAIDISKKSTLKENRRLQSIYQIKDMEKIIRITSFVKDEMTKFERNINALTNDTYNNYADWNQNLSYSKYEFVFAPSPFLNHGINITNVEYYYKSQKSVVKELKEFLYHCNTELVVS